MALTAMTVVALLLGGCGQATAHGVVDGYFRLPGRPPAELLRGGLNFRAASGGTGRGHVTRVGADGRYSVTLPVGSYSVIGALSGQPGKIIPESCAGTMHVVVSANHTTRADFVCHATPVQPPAS